MRAFSDICYLFILPLSNNPDSIKSPFYHNPFTPWTYKHRTWENLYPETFSGNRKQEKSLNAVQDQKAKLLLCNKNTSPKKHCFWGLAHHLTTAYSLLGCISEDVSSFFLFAALCMYLTVQAMLSEQWHRQQQLHGKRAHGTSSGGWLPDYGVYAWISLYIT